MTKKAYFLYNLRQIGVIFVASLLTAVSLEMFLLPGDVVVGGVLGISSILDIVLTGLSASKWYFSAGVWFVALNVPIIVYCFTKYRKRFAVKTMLYILLLGAELIILRLFDLSALLEKALYPDGGGSDKVIYTLVGGAVRGLSLPLMLSVNGSTGGSDIVGLIMQRKAKRSSSEAMRGILVADLIIVFCSSLVMYFVTTESDSLSVAMNVFIYSVSAIFVSEIVQETVFKGFSAAMELEVTTDKPREMAENLQRELVHGVTLVKVEGGYTRAEKNMVICVINKRQLTKARRVIRQTDENAFAYVENVKEVIGKGFSNKEIELDDGK